MLLQLQTPTQPLARSYKHMLIYGAAVRTYADVVVLGRRPVSKKPEFTHRMMSEFKEEEEEREKTTIAATAEPLPEVVIVNVTKRKRSYADVLMGRY